MTHLDRPVRIYGMLAEFESAEGVLAAARRAAGEGYRRMDAYTPFPVEGLAEAIGFHKTRVPLIVLIGGITGALGGFLMQWYANVISYRWVVAGRPHNSWPSWIAITFELTILFAGGAAVLGMLALNGLPRLHHPVFNAPNFQLASRDRFFLCIEASDPKYDPQATRSLLESLNPLNVTEVGW